MVYNNPFGRVPDYVHAPIVLYGYSSIVQGTWGFNGSANNCNNAATHANGDELQHKLWLPGGTYTLSFGFNKDADFGIAKLYIDGALIATQDMYNATPLSGQYLITLGIVLTGEGVRTIRWVVDGKHASSSGYKVAYVNPMLARTV